MKILKPCLLTTLVLSTTFILGCADQTTQENQNISEVIRPAKIATVISVGDSIQRSFPAQVSANASTELAFRVSGQITTHHVIEGDRVTRGSLIAELDPTDFNIQFDDSAAKYELAVAKHERNTTLVRKGLAAQAEYDTSRAEMLMAKAALDRAVQNLKYTKIYAPYDGVVAQIHSENHDHVGATQPIIAFQNHSLSDIHFDLPEKLLHKFDPASLQTLTTKVILDSYPERPLSATFKEMRKSTSSGTLSFRVTLSIEEPDDMRILPGMSANVLTILAGESLSSKKELIVPIGSIFSSELMQLESDRKFVWIVDSNFKTHLREVEVSRFVTDGAVIESGLNEGERVIAAGTYHIAQNQQVRELKRERGI